MRTSQRCVLWAAVVVCLLPGSALAQFDTADIGINKTDTPDPVAADSNLVYTIQVTNNGPDPASDVSWSDTLPAGTTFVSLSLPGGWSCTTPAVGAGGTVSCSNGSLAVSTASFTLTVRVAASVVDGTVLSNTATVTSTSADPDGDNNSATATTTVTTPITPIHDIQGPGASSPIVGNLVRIQGIVTGVASNGFFVQESDGEVDADPATSEGIFVFTSSAPPAAAAFAAEVMVTGTVSEFVPSSDPQQPPSTQLISPTTVQVATGLTLPTAVFLGPTFPDPTGPFDQLERLEHMRVFVDSLTVTGPSAGTVDEVAATGSSNGRFHGVVTGVSRPFREAGIQAPDVPPSGTIPPIPRWDSNPERLRIDSPAINGQPALTVKAGDLVTNLAGPLVYSERAYAILPDGTLGTPAIEVTSPTTEVSFPQGYEITVASFNLQRFYDAIDDPAIAEPVVSTGGYQNRLAKASIAIRSHLHNPDVIGVQSVENLGALGDLATQILVDGGPEYSPFLLEGNGGDGLDVGLLVKTGLVAPGGVPRVTVNAVLQQGLAEVWTDPNGNTAPLFDAPPLLVEAAINRSATVSAPFVVVVNHLLGLENIGSQVVNGVTTEGDLVRRRRQEQAQYVANLVQTRQTLDPAERLVVIGDFEALDANDGFVDVMNVIAGTPPPDNETVVPGDGVDLVNPDLLNLAGTAPATERYSRVPDGNAWNLEHVLVSAAVVADTSARRIEHARIGADYPETERDNPTAFRVSDHDPVVAYLTMPSLVSADISIVMTDAPDPVAPGTDLTYTITVTNSGPDVATGVSFSNTLPADTTFVSLTAPEVWDCTTPAVGEGGTVACSLSSAAVTDSVFVLAVAVPASAVGGTVLSSTATVTTTTTDPTPGDGSSTATTLVNSAPTISDIPNQTIAEDTSTPALPFVIGDIGTSPGSLVLSAGSSDTAIVPTANIVFGGAEVSRTVTVTPAPNAHGGPVVITITVSDGTFATVETFTVTVSSVNDVPTISDIPDQTIAKNTSTPPLPFTVADADGIGTLSISANSSHPTIVPNANIVIGGAGASRTVTVTPAADQHGGPVTITVTATDGTASATDTFLLTVTSANEPPTLSGLVDASVEETKTLTQTLTLTDDGSVNALTVTVASSNDALLPDSAGVVTGAGANRTLTLTPVPERTGETTITVTVSDGELTATRTARVTVTAAPAPDQPTGLVGTVAGNAITFTWTAPAAGATPTFYVLEGSTTPGATTLPVASTSTADTRWVVTLPAGAYSYRVRAANRAGTSGVSNEAAVVVGASRLPGPPSALVATVTGTQLSIQWAPNLVGGAPSLWQIELGSAPGARDRGIVAVPPHVTSAAGSLAAGEYLLRVRGVNAAGEGPPSNEVRLRIGTAPTCEAPEAPVLLPAVVIDNIVQLTWRASRNTAVGNYRVAVGSQPGAADLFVFDAGPVNVLAGLAPLPPPLRTYFVSVVAMNDCGVSPTSNTIRVDVGPGPRPPSNLRAAVDAGRVTLAWDPVPSVDGYAIDVGSAPGLTDLTSIPTVAPGLSVAGAPPGTYYVRVRAIRSGATSAPSIEFVLVVP